MTRFGAHCPNNGPRMDCKGNIVQTQVDGCAFCGPFARIFFSPTKRIDIFLNEIRLDKEQLKVMDEGIYEYTEKEPLFPFEWIFPLRNCSFMGLILPCPRQSEKYLINFYKTIESLFVCKNGKWVKS